MWFDNGILPWAYSAILYHFRVTRSLFDFEQYHNHDLGIWVRGNLKSILKNCIFCPVALTNMPFCLLIQTGTIRKLGCGFLFAFQWL